MKRVTLTLVAIAFSFAAQLPAATTIWVLRHAEKADDGTKDPALSDAGRARAAALAARLADTGVTVILSTGYERTRATVRPLAEASGLEITEYDPVDFAGLAERVRAIEGTVVVVGHSNTVIPIVNALGGEAEGEMTEADYGRLYRISVEGDEVRTELVPFEP